MIAASLALSLVNALIGAAYLALVIAMIRRDVGDIMRTRGAFVSPGWLLRVLPITVAACGGIVTALTLDALTRFGPGPHRALMTLIAACAAAFVVVLRFCVRRDVARRALDAIARHWDEQTVMVMLLTAHASILSSVIVAYVSVSPSPLAKARIYAWEFLDKR